MATVTGATNDEFIRSELARRGPLLSKYVTYPVAGPGERFHETPHDITTMSPDEFLSHAQPHDPEMARGQIEDFKEHMKSGKKLDPLHLFADGQEDGKKRAHAASELGIKHVPVIVHPAPGAVTPTQAAKIAHVNPVLSKPKTQAGPANGTTGVPLSSLLV